MPEPLLRHRSLQYMGSTVISFAFPQPTLPQYTPTVRDSSPVSAMNEHHQMFHQATSVRGHKQSTCTKALTMHSAQALATSLLSPCFSPAVWDRRSWWDAAPREIYSAEHWSTGSSTSLRSGLRHISSPPHAYARTTEDHDCHGDSGINLSMAPHSFVKPDTYRSPSPPQNSLSAPPRFHDQVGRQAMHRLLPPCTLMVLQIVHARWHRRACRT